MGLDIFAGIAIGVAAVFVGWFLLLQGKKVAAKISAWWNANVNAIKADVATMKADIAALKTKVGI